MYAISEAETQGHSHLPVEELVGRTAKLIEPGARPRGPGRRQGDGARRGTAPIASAPTPARSRWRRRCAPAPPPRRRSTTSPPRRRRPEQDGLTPEQWVGRARRLHLADHGPDRRARGRQDRLHGGDRRRGEAGQRLDRALRADRPRRPPPRGRDRARGVDDPPAAGVATGPGAGLRAGAPAAGRPRRRRRVLDAEPADDGGAAGRARGVDPRRLRRRRRPAAADRGRKAVRRSDRGRDRPGGPAQPDLPPGGALDDHHRGPRDQPGRDTSPRAARGPGARLLLHRPTRPRARARHRRRGRRRARPGPLRGRPDPRRPGAGPDVQGGGRDRRPQRAPPGAAQPRRPPRAQRPLPGRRPPDPDPQLARPRADERLDRLPAQRRPRGGRDRRRHRRRPAEDPLRGDRDAAARLRDLGPQGAGLRGPDRRRRLSPLARPDADQAAGLHGDHPRAPNLRRWSATAARWRWRCAATRAAAATRGWPSVCAARATRPAILPPMETPRPSPTAIVATLGGDRPAGGAGAGDRAAARSGRGGGPRRLRRGAQRASTASASAGRC